MTTIYEAIALAEQELAAVLAAYGKEANGDGEYILWASSPDGGTYTWWTPQDDPNRFG